MSQDLTDAQLKAIWRQGQIPAIFKRSRPLPVLLRVPFAQGNLEWLRDDRRTKPQWNGQFKAWEIPTTWFDSVIRLSLKRYRAVYVIQLYREQQKCAPACWNAEGFHCECSCMGEPWRRASGRKLVRSLRNFCSVLGGTTVLMSSFASEK